MWATPTFEELEATLEDPTSPIGKRMRAAYYCKQLYNSRNQDLSSVGVGESHGEQERRIVNLLCSQVFEPRHGSLLRHEFAYVLGQMQTPLACETLHKLLKKEDDCVMVRHEAAEALGAIASTASIDLLESTFKKYAGSLDELADTCRLALHRIRHPEDQVGCACMLAPFSSIDPIQPDPNHKDFTISELGDILCNPSINLVERYRAMFSLRNRGGVDSVKQLGRALTEDHSSPLLRHEVAFVLGQLQHPESIDDLERSLACATEHVMVRHESAEALGAIDVTSSEQWTRIECILTKYQQDPIAAVAESCVVALDAADYWGYSTVSPSSDSTIEQVPKLEQEEQETVTGTISQLPPLSSTSSFEVAQFGQLKHTDGKYDVRKDILAQHFNVASSTS